MEIKTTAIAGTMESSDIMVTLDPCAGDGIQIDLNSSVEKQFGDEIRSVIRETLEQLGILDARVTAVDKGALDCAIRARVKTAAYRASGATSFSWGGIGL